MKIIKQIFNNNAIIYTRHHIHNSSLLVGYADLFSIISLLVLVLWPLVSTSRVLPSWAATKDVPSNYLTVIFVSFVVRWHTWFVQAFFVFP